ncbi:hypothetical protein TcasGA2_TC013846 [Tribolium castaneum]|uniref:Uncharacterized protein n=1 Tax=Tribolium castaneum TaxID=7070 RepID=D6WNS1_TRICA|nr:PREDICTED: uncharacterized protein LOC107397945 [Tribolium castaneum]EFA03737.2 hypothetical protein TcasGA2_TC013846 [Tribolium castaneum]|eukprot:XP_015835566.1 PREDICTED: uncharacterized protein LOC107397945 [Tribolium castaneum]
MTLFYLLFGFTLIPALICDEEPITEDLHVLDETIAKYGPLQDYQQLGLPGPEIETDENKFLHANKFEFDETDNYILRIRTITPDFSYNARYEESIMQKENDSFEQFPVIKGQFVEHFPRESGGFYIRTIGYVVDDKGFREFFLDLTTARTKSDELPILGSGSVPISSTVLISLNGGNSLG